MTATYPGTEIEIEVGDWLVGGIGDGLDYGEVVAVDGPAFEVAWHGSGVGQRTTQTAIDELEVYTDRASARGEYDTRRLGLDG